MENIEQIHKLEAEICILEKDLARQYTEDLYQDLCKCRFQLNDVYNKKTEYALFRLRTIFYEGGDRRLIGTQVRIAMKYMKKCKLSEFDGLPVEYFDRFIDILASFITKVYLEAFDSETLPDTFNEALILLILKKDREATDPSSYGPVSLLIVDYKILTKILALRLYKVLPDVIQADQVGFVKGRSSTNNLKRLLPLT